MMTPQFLFDVASPNAYLVHRVLPEVEARSGRWFDYVPVLLGGLFKLSGNRAPMVAFAEVPKKLDYERLEFHRFMDRHGIDNFRWNPDFPVNSVMAMRTVCAAKEEERADLAEALFHFMWEEPRKLDDPERLHASLAEAGLDADRLIEATADQAVKDRLRAHTEAAYEKGAFGVPAFLLGDDLYFGKDRLGQVEEALAQR